MSTASHMYVAGLRVSPLSLEAATRQFIEDAGAGRPRVYAFVNGQSALLRRNSAEYARMLESPDVQGLVDGAAVELAARLSGSRAAVRCPGPDFFDAVARIAQDDPGVHFFLLGGAAGVAEKVRENLLDAYPTLSIVGTLSPPWGTWDETVSEELVRAVRSSGANALWLGVSAPKQETWALERLEQLGMPIACVGAAFDFIAGTKPRAPKAWRTLRLEWLFRLFSEPRRMWYRYLVGNSVFIADTVRYGKRPPQ